MCDLEKTRFSSPDDVKCQCCGGETTYHVAEECEDEPTTGRACSRSTLDVRKEDEPINRVRDVWCISNHEDDDNWFICRNCCSFHLQCPRCPGVQLCRFLGFEGYFERECFNNDGNCHQREEHRIRLPSINVLKKYYSKDEVDIIDMEFTKFDHMRFVVEAHPMPCVDFVKRFLLERTSRNFIEDYPALQDGFPLYYLGDRNRYYAGPLYEDDDDDYTEGHAITSDDTKVIRYRALITGPDGGFPHYWKCPRCQKHYRLTDK